MRNYILIVTGSRVYLPNGPRVESFTITDEEMDDMRITTNGAPDDKLINYIIDDITDEWNQGFCQALVVPEEDIETLKTRIILATC